MHEVSNFGSANLAQSPKVFRVDHIAFQSAAFQKDDIHSICSCASALNFSFSYQVFWREVWVELFRSNFVDEW